MLINKNKYTEAERTKYDTIMEQFSKLIKIEKECVYKENYTVVKDSKSTDVTKIYLPVFNTTENFLTLNGDTIYFTDEKSCDSFINPTY